jgi:translocation and assembly module TamB
LKRATKIVGWGLAGFLLLLVLLVGAVMVAGNTDAGRAWIAQLTFKITAGTVKLTGLNGSFPSDLTLEELQLIDRGGVWLTADHIALNWSPWRLLDRRIQVNRLRASLLHIERAPLSSGGSGKTTIPFIEVGQFAVERVELGAPLTGAAVALAAQGNVRLRSLEDANANLQVRRLDGDGEYTLQLKFDPKRMDASLSLHEPAGGPLENLLSLPGLGALSATATVAGPRAAEVVDVSLAAGDLKAHVAGRVDLGHQSADLDYSLTAPAMAPRPEVSWARLDLQGNFHGTIAAPNAKGRLEADKLRIAGGTLIAKLVADLDAGDGNVAAHALVSGLEIPGPQPRFLTGAPLKIDAAVHLKEALRPLELTATHPLFSLRANAQTLPDKDGKALLTAELKLPNMASFEVFTGQDVTGSAVLNARLTHRPGEDSLTSDATLLLTGGKAGWIDFVGPRVALQVAGTLSPENLRIDNVRVAGRGLTVAASGSAKRVTSPPLPGKPAATGLAQFVSEIQARWQVDLADLAALSPDVAGDAKATGKVSGAPSSLVADADLTSHLSVHGSPTGTVTAAVHARGLPSNPTATLQAHGMLDGAPLSLDAEVNRDGANAFRLLVKQAEWKSAHADGDMTADAAFKQSHGQLNLRIGQLGDLDRLLGTTLSGSADASVGFVPAHGQSKAQLHVNATNLVVGQFAGNVHLQAEGVSNALGLQFTAEVPDLYGFPAGVASTAVLNIDDKTLQLASAALVYRAQTLKLLAPARLSFAKGLAVDEVKLGVQDAVLDLKGQLSPTLDLRASVLQVKPGLINVFSPGLLASGLIEAHARLQGSPADPTGRVRLDATDIRFADDAATGLPAVDLHARAQLADGMAALNSTLDAGGASKLTAAGNVPLNAAGALAMKIGGKLDVALANPFLEARGMRATGELTADASITGSLAAPVVGGGVTLAQGTLRDYARGVNLTDITGEVIGREGTLQVKTFKATAASGSIGMTGSLGILQPGMPVDLTITAKNAEPIASNIVTANLDANIHVLGTVRKHVDVTGTIHVNRATIGIPNALPPDVAVLDVRRRGKGTPVAAQQQLVIGIDLAIEAPREILVQGRGLDAEMGGTIKLSGTSDALLASGGLDLLRGSFTLVGNKLTFDQGSKISFDGAGLQKKIDPSLYFTAHTTLGSTTATLSITGFADAPKFEFSSSPTLPQDQILAQLLFGESAASLTAVQAAELGAALATLSGVGGGGPGVLGKLQKTLGLDRLSVGADSANKTATTESSGYAVSAGRYISKRVYIEGKQSTTGTTQVQVDVDLTKHLKLQTRLGNGSAVTQGTTPETDPGSSVGLSYQFEY